jgi:hypothetical protein
LEVIQMRRLFLIGIAALALFVVSPAQAQDVNAQNQLVRLLDRTEARHRGARQNFERMVGDYPDFLPELQTVAARLGTPPEWLLNVMACESSFISSARNRLPGQTASGLMQIIEQTAAGLGTTTAAIRRMNPIEQLRLIEKYYWPFRGRLNSLADVYLAAFRGFLVDGGSDTVVAPLNSSVKERRAYSLNSSLDLNRDRTITKGELESVAFGVGRFGVGAQLIAMTRSQINKPEQKPVVSAGGQNEVVQAGSRSVYTASKAGTSKTPKTRSIYVH